MLETKKWLKVRVGVYQKYSTLPDLCETISIKIHPPKYGWIDVSFRISGREYQTTLSSYPEPFKEIKHWLEHIIVKKNQLDSTLNLDCDGTYNIIFHYESHFEPKEEKGIFYLHDSTEDEYLDGYVKKKDLIRAIYKSILDYAIEYEQEDGFQENWLDYFTEDDYPSGKLSAEFRSVVVEEYLKD